MLDGGLVLSISSIRPRRLDNSCQWSKRGRGGERGAGGGERGGGEGKEELKIKISFTLSILQWMRLAATNRASSRSMKSTDTPNALAIDVSFTDE